MLEVRAIRFIVFGDSKGKPNGINEKVLIKIMKESSKLIPEPEFIVMLGDTVAGSEKETDFAAQLITLRKLIKLYHPEKVLLPVIGNHEVNIEPIDDRYEKVFSKIYEDLCLDGFLSSYNNTVYYKDFEHLRIIILNSFHANALHKIDEKQQNWLKNEASATEKNKLLCVHSPAYPTGAHFGHCLDLYPENRNAFWNAVDECGIAMVFSGHEHNYSRRLIDHSFGSSPHPYNRSIYQIVTGGGGEKLKDKYVDKRGVAVKPIDTYHFLIVDAEKHSIKVTAVSYKGKKLDEFRVDSNF